MTAPGGQRGFTMIELLVVFIIGLVISLSLVSVIGYFEGSRRATSTVNDMENASAAALQQLEYAIRNAGSGIALNNAQSYGCTVYASRGGTSLLPLTAALPAPFEQVFATLPTLRLAPVIILNGNTDPTKDLASTSGSSDVLLVFGAASGGASGAANPNPLAAPPQSNSLTMATAAGLSQYDILLVTDVPGATAAGNCLVEEIAKGGVPATNTTGATSTVNLGGTYYSATPGGATLTNLSTDSQVVPIGNMLSTDGGVNTLSDNLPQYQLLGVGNSDAPSLYNYDLLSGSTQSIPIADSLLEIHAIYGLDTNGDNVIDEWVTPASNASFAPATLLNGSSASAALLQQIKAIHLGLILRNNIAETNHTTSVPAQQASAAAASSNGTNLVTASQLVLFSNLPCLPNSTCTDVTDGITTTFQYTRALSAAEQQYRYRTLEVTIPIRNAMMVNCGSNC